MKTRVFKHKKRGWTAKYDQEQNHYLVNPLNEPWICYFVPAWFIEESKAWQEITFKKGDRFSEGCYVPILTTEDGVELFKGDKYAAYRPEFPDIIVEDRIDAGDPMGKGDWLYFSTREAAEEYRLYNYRGLSLKDLDDHFQPDIGEPCYQELEELVKSRL